MLVRIFLICIWTLMGSPKPQWFSEGKRSHTCTTEETSLKLFQVKPGLERSVTSHCTCTLRSLLVSKAISDSLKLAG